MLVEVDGMKREEGWMEIGVVNNPRLNYMLFLQSSERLVPLVFVPSRYTQLWGKSFRLQLPTSKNRFLDGKQPSMYVLRKAL